MVKPPQASGIRARKFRQFVASGHPLAWAGERPLLCAAVCFVLVFATRLLFSRLAGPLVLCFSPDEWRYLHLAKSIAEGGPLRILGLPTDYQKILYPLLISPAFVLTRNPVAQVKLIEVINCLTMASMAFPAALLVKKLSPRPAVLLLTLAFAATLPDLMYIGSFMSEALYLPLCLWLFYFFLAAMEEQGQRRRLLFFALFGLFTCMAYLAKEIAAAFLIAAAAMLILEGVRDKKWKQNALALGLVLSAFFAPFLAVKQTLFPGMGNSYNGNLTGRSQLDLAALKEPGAFTYLFFSAAATLAAAVLSFYILPVLLPLFDYRKLDEKKRRMYLFIALSLVITAGAIAYTVSIREDLEDRVPRLHLRMFAPMVIPCIILCFDCLLSGAGKKQKRGKKSILILVAALCVLLPLLLPVVPAKDGWYDHASLTVSYLAFMLQSFGMAKFSANLVWLAYQFFMLALTAVGALCFLRKKKKAVLVMLLCAVCTVNAADNLWHYLTVWRSRHFDEQQIYDATEGSRDSGNYFACVMNMLFPAGEATDPYPITYAAGAVSNYIQGLEDAPDGRILICGNNMVRLTFETYASQHLQFCDLSTGSILQGLKSGSTEYVFDETNKTRGWRVRYIIVTENFNPFENAELLYRQPPYLVLRNSDPAKLYFSAQEVDIHG